MAAAGSAGRDRGLIAWAANQDIVTVVVGNGW